MLKNRLTREEKASSLRSSSQYVSTFMCQYGLSEGYMPLRETMKKYLAAKENMDFTDNELFIVSGGQQCADLTTKVLVIPTIKSMDTEGRV